MEIKTSKLQKFIAVTELSKMQGVHNPCGLYNDILARLRMDDYNCGLVKDHMIPHDMVDIIYKHLFLGISTPEIISRITDVVMFMTTRAEEAFILNNNTLGYIASTCINRFSREEIQTFNRAYAHERSPTYSISAMKSGIESFYNRLELEPDRFPAITTEWADTHGNMNVHNGENSCIVNKLLSLYTKYYVHMGSSHFMKGTLYNTRTVTSNGKGIVPSISYRIRSHNKIVNADLTMVKLLDKEYDVMWCDSCDDANLSGQLITVKPVSGREYDLEVYDRTTMITLLHVREHDKNHRIKVFPKCEYFLKHKGIQIPSLEDH